MTAVLASASAGHAQTPRDTGTTIIRASELFDSERGTFTSNVDILVRGNRIDSVGPGLSVPSGARVIDLRRWNNTPNRGQLTLDEMRAIVQTAKQLGVTLRHSSACAS